MRSLPWFLEVKKEKRIATLREREKVPAVFWLVVQRLSLTRQIKNPSSFHNPQNRHHHHNNKRYAAVTIKQQRNHCGYHHHQPSHLILVPSPWTQNGQPKIKIIVPYCTYKVLVPTIFYGHSRLNLIAQHPLTYKVKWWDFPGTRHIDKISSLSAHTHHNLLFTGNRQPQVVYHWRIVWLLRHRRLKHHDDRWKDITHDHNKTPERCKEIMTKTPDRRKDTMSLHHSVQPQTSSPRYLATVCISLSPLPQRFTRTIWSGDIPLAICQEAYHTQTHIHTQFTQCRKQSKGGAESFWKGRECGAWWYKECLIDTSPEFGTLGSTSSCWHCIIEAPTQNNSDRSNRVKGQHQLTRGKGTLKPAGGWAKQTNEARPLPYHIPYISSHLMLYHIIPLHAYHTNVHHTSMTMLSFRCGYPQVSYSRYDTRVHVRSHSAAQAASRPS